MLSERPFVSCHIARRVRKMASYKFRNNQFTEAEFDQFMAKCRAPDVVDQLCDIVEEASQLRWAKLDDFIHNNWTSFRAVVDGFPEVNLEQPLGHYNAAPKSRGRRALRDRGPRYQTEAAFVADKELFLSQADGLVVEEEIEDDSTDE